MKRTINPTGKIRLTQDQVTAELVSVGEGYDVLVAWNFSGLELKSNLETVLEIYASDATREILGTELGKEGSRQVPLRISQTDGQMRLSLKLIDTDDLLRRIVAETSPIFLNADSNEAKSLLKTQAKPDLARLWDIDFSNGEPVLQILNKGNSYRELTSSELFLFAILPSAVEKITELVICEQDSFDSEILSRWENFLELFGLSEDELLSMRQELEEASTPEFLANVRGKSREIAHSYSQKFNMTDISLFESKE
jgi:hypothetical protein